MEPSRRKTCSTPFLPFSERGGASSWRWTKNRRASSFETVSTDADVSRGMAAEYDGPTVAELERKQERTPVPKDWTYAPAPEARDIVRLGERYGHYIGGEFVEPEETYPTISPASEEQLAEVGQATPAEVGRAVAAAREAFENGWSGVSPSERAKYLFRIARILQERSREFAVLESLNGGKTIREARDVDLPLSAAHFFYYAGWADKLEYAFPNRQPQPV